MEKKRENAMAIHWVILYVYVCGVYNGYFIIFSGPYNDLYLLYFLYFVLLRPKGNVGKSFLEKKKKTTFWPPMGNVPKKKKVVKK